METQTPVKMPSDIDSAPIGKHQAPTVAPIRTRSLSINSYDTVDTPKAISDEQQEAFRKKHDVHDEAPKAHSPAHIVSAVSPHKLGQKAIVMPKAMHL
ncbi:hypothetical protein SDRG_10594 [Saprolegnia diclina VS20]|uniref:Uncharacterized protein n=1 Tax=Saprolegnia diclina (strain VS20) TaxID=1156394 RepID=T0QE02_SAPDV|nr:hypothetical protein SDRG_10594 [Saprolegnia diclina VS20]EQC31805.1 hypothetical protein SDRG_10594 [Saprolegnia diclina VS20]|eukprot:XP_008614812.1 hypothetical protein SDRG_10594 [Saprolegnia diclina VS20]